MLYCCREKNSKICKIGNTGTQNTPVVRALPLQHVLTINIIYQRRNICVCFLVAVFVLEMLLEKYLFILVKLDKREYYSYIERK
jgi:hypothetical protein